MRTDGCCRAVEREISRFPCKERLHMPGSLTTPGRPGARDDAPGCVAFRYLHGVGTRNRTLSRLNGWPMRPPVNASPKPSRATAHDSGPMWIANSFIVRDLHSLLLAGLPALRKSRPPCPPERTSVSSRPRRAIFRLVHRNIIRSSSAMTSSDGGSVMPSIRGVLRLMRKSNFVEVASLFDLAQKRFPLDQQTREALGALQ